MIMHHDEIEKMTLGEKVIIKQADVFQLFSCIKMVHCSCVNGFAVV